ncbi:PepSY domain-containing protein [Janthinobacterium sp. DSP2-3-3]|uniref:PepSY domain-containing protein n=1 Tax=Janthinobacterium sp. DSP2-3-3 TaxID=2804596 RepID=UPI003CF6027E
MSTVMAAAKRFSYQLHRWTGVFSCILMALWFISGMVMLFVGYPKLTPWERLASMPTLQSATCCIGPDKVLEQLAAPASVRELVLTSVGGRPVYRVRDEPGRFQLFDARSGKPADLAGPAEALAAAQAFLPGAKAAYLGQVREDRWTHSRGLDPHRPLHMVKMDDADDTLLYLSSVTGEVLIDAPRSQRLWNFVGAWLHWVYPLRERSSDPLWSWTVIILSATATVTAVSGTLVGIWRWRFTQRYKSGARSPYRETYMHWHHIIGLLFAAIVCTWIFSGLMSMNPFRIFDAKGKRPDLAAYRGGTPATARLALTPQQALAMLEAERFHASEIAWRVLDGQPYLLVRDAAARTRLIVANDGSVHVREQWGDATLLRAASKLLPGMPTSHAWLGHYDTYYYGRQPEAMMGAAERRLPVLRVQFLDPHANWVYIDSYTGDVAITLDRSQRVSRWLFSFLHSWDLPPLLQMGPLRDAILILLSLGGMALSTTGVVIGFRRMRLWIRN